MIRLWRHAVPAALFLAAMSALAACLQDFDRFEPPEGDAGAEAADGGADRD